MRERSPLEAPQLAGAEDQQSHPRGIMKKRQRWRTEKVVFKKGAEKQQPDRQTRSRLFLEEGRLMNTW